MQQRNEQQLQEIEKGGYVLIDCEDDADLTIIATGSEVELAVQAAAKLTDHKVKVVSMPCCERFDEQDLEYKNQVLGKSGKRLAIEAATGDLWYKYVGLDGDVISMSSFGESAPADQLFKEFGFTVENVVKKATDLIR